MDYDSFISDYGKKYVPNSLRESARMMDKEGVIMLGAGVPNSKTFPIESIKMKLKDGSYIEWDETTTAKALQYLPSDGYLDFIGDLKQLIRKYHNPPRFDDLKICLTTGSQDGLHKVFSIIINPGDYIIVPKPVYIGALGIIKPLGAKIIGVSEDENGMRVDELRKALEKVKDVKNLKALYLNPNSSNPSCITYSLNCRKQIYELAKEFNFLIIEDDAYYFLNFGKERPPSFLSLDTDGRVIRVDSFSKIISPGLRIGFMSGPPTIVSKVEIVIQFSTQQTSSFSQMVVFHMLKQWGEHGFNCHVARVNAFYKNQALVMMESAKKHLTGLAEWYEPNGGMFMWMKILKVKDTVKFCFQAAVASGVIVVPGKDFNPDGSDSPYIRLAFSLETADKIDEGMKRLAKAIREHNALT